MQIQSTLSVQQSPLWDAILRTLAASSSCDPSSICSTPPGFPSLQYKVWKLSPDSKMGWWRDILHLFSFSQKSYCSVLSDVQCLKYVFSYNLYVFLIISDGRVNMAPVTPSWSKVKSVSQQLFLKGLSCDRHVGSLLLYSTWPNYRKVEVELAPGTQGSKNMNAARI